MAVGKTSRLNRNLVADRERGMSSLGGQGKRPRESEGRGIQPGGGAGSGGAREGARGGPSPPARLANQGLKGVALADACVAAHRKGDEAEADATARVALQRVQKLMHHAKALSLSLSLSLCSPSLSSYTHTPRPTSAHSPPATPMAG